MHKSELIGRIKTTEGLTAEDKAALINLLNTHKKYGLVWEDKPEAVEEQLRTQLPVLDEVKDRALLSGGENPNHILIEGDNLHALTALTFTHEGKIDVIYIDPPYNTGAKDWKYNNDYVDKEDSFKHSKWLSFMKKRLEIAKKLLKDEGIICVTIDDYEMPRLFILLEEIFGEENHLGTIVIRNNPSGRSTVKGISITHEYGLFFGKTLDSKVGRLSRNEEQRNRYDLFDGISQFEWVNFRKHGGTKKESPTMFYPIIITNNQKIRIPELEWDYSNKEWLIKEKINEEETIIYPIDEKGQERRWKWSIERLINNLNEFSIKPDRTGKLGVYVKSRMNDSGVLPLTWWDKKEYSSTAYGTNFIKEIFGELQVFSYPKSIYAVKDSLIVLSNNSSSLILDFFAGSGTTLHATMQLNAEDGGSRQCILVTNNENNIAEEVCYERNKRVIEGYTNSKGQAVEGLKKNNLRYYKCDFVGRRPTIKNKVEITRLSTDLLCIKEDIYYEVKEAAGKSLNPQEMRCFSHDKLYLLVIYDEGLIDAAVRLIQQTVATEPEAHFKIYIFSNGQYAFTEEFEDVQPYVTLCALPDAIYKAYQNILPKVKKEKIPQIEENTAQEAEQTFQNDLFSTAG